MHVIYLKGPAVVVSGNMHCKSLCVSVCVFCCAAEDKDMEIRSSGISVY